MNTIMKLAIACFVVSICLAASSAAAAQSADEAAIQNLEKNYINAFNAKDVGRIMASYQPGEGLFVFDVTPPRQHVGWADYQKDWQDLFAAFPGPIHQEMVDLHFKVVGPVAYGHNIQSGYLTRKDGTRLNVAVRVTDVYRKEHGRWLIVQEHVSVPVDLDAGKPDLLSKP